EHHGDLGGTTPAELNGPERDRGPEVVEAEGEPEEEKTTDHVSWSGPPTPRRPRSATCLWRRWQIALVAFLRPTPAARTRRPRFPRAPPASRAGIPRSSRPTRSARRCTACRRRCRWSGCCGDHFRTGTATAAPRSRR